VNVNFFTWIREGVKQSVLLGVGDAIDTIGTPEPRTEQPEILAFLRSDADSSTKKSAASSTSTRSTATKRKRLGKSLKDINPQT
jgi:hypothetical protein